MEKIKKNIPFYEWNFEIEEDFHPSWTRGNRPKILVFEDEYKRLQTTDKLFWKIKQDFEAKVSQLSHLSNFDKMKIYFKRWIKTFFSPIDKKFSNISPRTGFYTDIFDRFKEADTEKIIIDEAISIINYFKKDNNFEICRTLLYWYEEQKSFPSFLMKLLNIQYNLNHDRTYYQTMLDKYIRGREIGVIKEIKT